MLSMDLLNFRILLFAIYEKIEVLEFFMIN